MERIHEAKTKLSDQEYEDMLLTYRARGFDNKADYVRWLILHDLYGAMAQIKVNHYPGALTGRKSDDSGRD